jgi:predicted enzyme related to lactoylglutathione lyase
MQKSLTTVNLTFMNTIGYFEIQSSDPERDVTFYQTVFGWKFTRMPQVPIEYYSIETNSITGGLLKRPANIPPAGSGTNAFVCSIQVEDFDTTSALILAQGGIVAMAKFAIPGKCWQGYFLDLDGNTLGLFEANENAQ